MKKRCFALAALALVPILAGCSPAFKNSEYTFNQGVPTCQGQPAALRGAVDNPTSTGAGSTNSGGSGNTIIIIESTAQDSQANPDLSGVADTVADKLTGVLTDIPAVFETMTDQGNVVEVE